jgi:hypothetical protein
MYLGYKDEKIKFYTEQPLDTTLYGIDRIEETDKEYVLDGEQYILKDEAWEEKQAQKEAERIAMLNLTAADVERAIYKAKGLDFNDVISLVEKQKATIDIKALQIELKANNFYRGNPYIDAVGTILGFTNEQLDKFFDTNDYRYLTTCKLKVNAIPEDAVIEINSEIQSEITVPYGSTVDIVVSCKGYISRKDVLTLTEDRTLEVVLDEDTTGSDTNTTDTEQPTNVSNEVETKATNEPNAN